MDNVVLQHFTRVALVVNHNFFSISDFTTKSNFNNSFCALVVAMANGIISYRDRHRGFQTVRTTPVKLTVHNIKHLIYFKCP